MCACVFVHARARTHVRESYMNTYTSPKMHHTYLTPPHTHTDTHSLKRTGMAPVNSGKGKKKKKKGDGPLGFLE